MSATEEIERMRDRSRQQRAKESAHRRHQCLDAHRLHEKDHTKERTKCERCSRERNSKRDRESESGGENSLERAERESAAEQAMGCRSRRESRASHREAQMRYCRQAKVARGTAKQHHLPGDNKEVPQIQPTTAIESSKVRWT